MPSMNREIRLAKRPVGWPVDSDFERVETPIPEPAEGEVLVRNVYMSVDPYMRGRMDQRQSYVPSFEVGAPLEGGAVGVVQASRHPDFAEGDCVLHMLGWREYATPPGAGLRKLDPGTAPLSHHLGALGMPGLTAYVGLLDLGKPQPGETVFVSAAAGAVGSLVGQIAKLQGCHTAGSAGSDAKVQMLLEEFGFDAAFNYKTEEVDAALARVCPQGIDVYFDNVGGEQLDAALALMNPFGRITACGMISQYNAESAGQPLRNLMLIVGRRISVRGFIVADHFDRFPDFLADMSRWISEEKIAVKETVREGIGSAIPAFLGLLRGQNVGKMVVRLSPDPGRSGERSFSAR